jgi:hypothetical protein
LLALLLWPIDVGIRRVSVSRGDLALAGAWTAARWRAWRGPARRTQQVGDMLATKSRAGGAAARAALVRPKDESPTETTPAGPQGSAQPAPVPTTPPPAAPAQGSAEPPSGGDTIARLREAKQRARDRESRDHS